MLDLAREILQTLSHNKLRTALTGIAVAWGIFMLIVLLGASRGLYNATQRNNGVEQSSYASVWGGWTGKAHKGYKEGRLIRLKDADLEPVMKDGGPHIERADATMSVDTARVSTQKEYITGGIYGAGPNAEVQDRVKMKHGRFINDRDMAEHRKVVVLQADQARLLFGDEAQAVGKRVDCMGLSWVVVGVYENEWRRTTYAPFNTVMMLTGNKGNIDEMQVKLKGMDNEQDVQDVNAALRGVLSQRHDFAEDDQGAVHVWNRFENYIAQGVANRVLNAVVWIIGLLTLLSGIVGVSNIMFVSVRERTHEIGIRRAIGAKPRSILVQVLAESVAITAIFGYIGVFMGIVVTEILDKTVGQTDFLYNPRVDIGVAVQVTVVLVLVGALAGFFPAKKATKVKPVEALRDE